MQGGYQTEGSGQAMDNSIVTCILRISREMSASNMPVQRCPASRLCPVHGRTPNVGVTLPGVTDSLKNDSRSLSSHLLGFGHHPHHHQPPHSS
jgi:hypothetical protein